MATAAAAAAAGELINVLREAKQKVPESLLSFGTTVKVSSAGSKMLVPGCIVSYVYAA
jgi:hypothetical protein